MSSKFFAHLAFLAAPLLAVAGAHATVISLTDGNSFAQIVPDNSNGMFSWVVQGQPELAQQWFWYRIGDSGPEFSIDTISAPTVTQAAPNNVEIKYSGAGFSVSIRYLLTGGVSVTQGSYAMSDIAETITINNTGTTPLPFHFFQYSDFDLDFGNNDTVQLAKVGIPQRYVAADQVSATTTMTETVVSPKAGHGETGFFPFTLNRLNDGSPTTLADNAGAVGPGDVTWALEWDFTGLGGTDYPAIAPNSSQIISKDKQLTVLVTIPEPASLMTIAAGAVLLLGRRRRTLAK